MMNDRRTSIRGVIFDFDGTLVQSTIDFAAMKEAILDEIDRYGLPYGIIDAKASSTNNIIAAWKHLSTIYDDVGMFEFERRIERASTKVEMRNVGATIEVPGATKTLEVLRSIGHATGILTRGSRRYVETALIASGIPFDTEHIVCRDDHRLIEAKPNPIALVRAARVIGLEPENCIYVGDHWMDHDCAISAGIPFIGVLSGHNDRERWKGRESTKIVDNITDIMSILSDIEGY